ncbi:MAG: hypothetical protein LBV12_04665 [Puniceicoccales bacterium]|jgi:hypothetical protein|nr:hypothetical protein [Puniceicoccales bacterium]
MAKQETVIIWEKSLYCNVEGKGFRKFALPRMEDAIAIIQEHIKEGTKLALIYDPDVLHTEYTECPSGGRNIVREAVSTTHEGIANIHTAWGYQTPVPVPGSNGSNSTFVSYETVPSLLLLKRGLEDIKRPLQRAFPLLSLATQAGSSPGRTSIFIIVDHESQAFVYLHTSTGVRACRKLYSGKRDDYYDVWAEISLVFGEYGLTFDDGGQRPAIRVYQAPGTDIKTQCPYWETLHQMAQVESYNLSVLAGLLNNLPARHCSSLMEDMPRTVRMDLGFQIANGVVGLVLLGVGIYAFMVLSEQSQELTQLKATQSSLTLQKGILMRNKGEMEKLQALFAKGIFEAGKGRMKLLEVLSVAIPRDATLISASAGIEEKHAFQLKGIFWNASTDGPAGRGSSAHSNTLVTPISLSLANLVSGLLVGDKTTFVPATGDFNVIGTTPIPQEEMTTAPPAAKR